MRVRPVHRRELLEAMAEELPPGTIRFSSRLASIGTEPAAGGGGGEELAVVGLDDGTVIRSRVLVGCDGVHSAVARWLGMAEPASSGRSCVRGLAVYPGGHGVRKELRQFLSHGLRAGMVPISDTDIYWFVVNNTVPAGKPAQMPRIKICSNLMISLLQMCLIMNWEFSGPSKKLLQFF